MAIWYFILNHLKDLKSVHNRGSVINYVQIWFCHYKSAKKHQQLKAEQHYNMIVLTFFLKLIYLS